MSDSVYLLIQVGVIVFLICADGVTALTLHPHWFVVGPAAGESYSVEDRTRSNGSAKLAGADQHACSAAK
jgi:hypothetical protein